jgi:hypothetical protein
MAWYAYLAYFFGGVFLANGVPHFVHGISGKKFQSPFDSPPGVGESSPLVNVLWGAANFIVGYVLIFGVGDFSFGFTTANECCQEYTYQQFGSVPGILLAEVP